jgi:hypothetical protein
MSKASRSAVRRCAKYFSFLCRHGSFFFGSLTVLSEQHFTILATRSPNCAGWYSGLKARLDLQLHRVARLRLLDPRRLRTQGLRRRRPSDVQCREWSRLFGAASGATQKRSAMQRQIATLRTGRSVSFGVAVCFAMRQYYPTSPWFHVILADNDARATSPKNPSVARTPPRSRRSSSRCWIERASGASGSSDTPPRRNTGSDG